MLAESTTRARENLTIWYKRLREVWEFQQAHGGEYPLQDAKLRRWVQSQRATDRASRLTQDQVEALNGLGFGWNGNRPPLERTWNCHYQELRAYHTRHGHCLVPPNFPVWWSAEC
jgi:Helicase associated domain